MKNGRFDWGMGAAAAVLMGTGLVVVGVSTRPVEAAAIDNTLDPRLVVASFTSADDAANLSSEMKRVSVLRNETLSGVLDRIGAPREEANGAVFAASQLIDLRGMRPGDDVTAWLETGTDGIVRLMGVSLRPEAETQVLVSRGLDGSWTSHELKAKLSPGISYVAGDVDQSIYQTATGLGATDQQIVDYAEIFGYDIDFQREVRTGDRFGMLYETFEDERGQQVKTGTVLMATMDGAALSKAFYRYTPSDDGVVDYFDESGQSAKKFLMKTPINGARLSSSFGNRKHPVLGYTKLHKGTDFAAPTGTPIYAAGNGKVVTYGPNGTYGNFAKIEHANGYTTAYAHMSRFAKGVGRGSYVKQGQVIGYVGTTGRSTGPHLHYEVYVNKKPVNAMTLKLPTGRKLGGEQLQAFLAEKARIEAMRDAELMEEQMVAANTAPAAAPALVSAPAPASVTPETRDGAANP
ncbi:MAG: M23 family metallopeptidase [Hyphomonadaceae bacterium]|nr:M23 family metallopeptidase [Hyphomonadaceae bacterium]